MPLAYSILCTYQFCWGVPRVALVTQGRSSTCSATLESHQCPPSDFCLPKCQMPVIWMSKSMGRFVQAETLIRKTGPLRYLLGFQATQSQGQN